MSRPSFSGALLGFLLTSVSACSGGRTQADCDAIAQEIRDAAAARGIPAQGICSSQNPTVQKDFGAKCQELRECNDDLDGK